MAESEYFLGTIDGDISNTGNYLSGTMPDYNILLSDAATGFVQPPTSGSTPTDRTAVVLANETITGAMFNLGSSSSLSVSGTFSGGQIMGYISIYVNAGGVIDGTTINASAASYVSNEGSMLSIALNGSYDGLTLNNSGYIDGQISMDGTSNTITNTGVLSPYAFLNYSSNTINIDGAGEYLINYGVTLDLNGGYCNNKITSSDGVLTNATSTNEYCLGDSISYYSAVLFSTFQNKFTMKSQGILYSDSCDFSDLTDLDIYYRKFTTRKAINSTFFFGAA